MRLEVIIPAYRPGTELDEIIRKLQKQVLQPDRITILLTADDTEEVEKLQQRYDDTVCVQGIPKINFSHGGTRQAGMDGSDAEYVLFMTQDAIPVNDMLTQNLYDALQKPDAAVAYARQLPKADADPVEKFSRRFNYPKVSHTQAAINLEKNGIKAIFCSDSCAMYNHKLHSMLGGFDTKTDFAEDAIYAYSVLTHGYTVEYCAEAKIYHSHNLTYRQHFMRNMNIARAQKARPEIYGNLKSESEGIKYFLTGSRFFNKKKQYKNSLKLFWTCVVRFLGYRAGKIF